MGKVVLSQCDTVTAALKSTVYTHCQIGDYKNGREEVCVCMKREENDRRKKRAGLVFTLYLLIVIVRHFSCQHLVMMLCLAAWKTFKTNLLSLLRPSGVFPSSLTFLKLFLELLKCQEHVVVVASSTSATLENGTQGFLFISCV